MTSRVILTWLLAVLVLAASTHRIPLIDHLPETKLFLFSAEVLSALLLLMLIAERRAAGLAIFVIGLILLLRTAFGSAMAYLTFEQPILASLQEARFGVMLVVAPLAYFYLRAASGIELRRFLGAHLLVLLIVDLVLLRLSFNEPLLTLGVRTENRFFCSVVPPLSVALALVLRRAPGDARDSIRFAAVIGVALLVHVVLITTSRMETLFVIGFLTFLACQRWPQARLVAYITVAVVVPFAGAPLGEYVARSGRDYTVAIGLLEGAIPLGYGAVTDSSARAFLEIPDGFFFSDYGVLLYMLRYGLGGLVLAAGLLLVWVQFGLAMRKWAGSPFISVPALFYLFAVPLLDYGTLVSSFLFGVMFLAIVGSPLINVHSRYRGPIAFSHT